MDDTRILHSPPCRPDINIVQYKGVSDKLLMMFNSNINQMVERPIAIMHNEEELGFWKKQVKAQRAYGDRLSPYPDLYRYINESCDFIDVDPLKNSILFESDDPLKCIEIFKAREKPTEYKDFATAERIIVPAWFDNLDGSRRYLYSTSYEDTIRPNTKYYYCFRAVDIHDNISNPTDLFEVEMFKEDEVIFLNFQRTEFAPKILFDKKKSFKKYIKIQPAIDQVQIPPANAIHETRSFDLIDQEERQLQNNPFAIAQQNVFMKPMESTNDHDKDFADVTVGSRGHKLYTSGKTFRFRFRSKNTGKAFDLDVDFAKEDNFVKIDPDDHDI
tara:strand:- start:581 stop:1570 length:990 start_codon:yes stop_codon:yes gene_type:complete